MKPLLITFFLVILGYSLFFDDEQENLVPKTNSVSTNKELVTMKQDDYGTFYAKIMHNENDSITKKSTFVDYFIQK